MDVPEALGLKNVMFFDALLTGVGRHRLAASSCFAGSSDLRSCRPPAVDMVNVKATRADTRTFLAPNILERAITTFTLSLLFLDSRRGWRDDRARKPRVPGSYSEIGFVIQVGLR